MRNRIGVILILICLGISLSEVVFAAAPPLPPLPPLPPVTPGFCAETICVFARGPYVLQKSTALSDGDKETLALTFKDGTVISFAAVSTRSDCRDFYRKWLNNGELNSVTFLCAYSSTGDNILVAVHIRAPVASSLRRFQGESEICMWRLNLDKSVQGNSESLRITNETCVGSRVGYALPAQRGTLPDG